jgi:predicted N-formylglutamate amidohydrolase
MVPAFGRLGTQENKLTAHINFEVGVPELSKRYQPSNSNHFNNHSIFQYLVKYSDANDLLPRTSDSDFSPEHIDRQTRRLPP